MRKPAHSDFLKTLFVIILCGTSLLIISCKKPVVKDPPPPPPPAVTTELKSGLPENHKKLHVYMYAALNLPEHMPMGDNRQLTGFVVANDPAQNLIPTLDHNNEFMNGFASTSGNVSLGTIFFNDMELTGGGDPFRYFRRFFQTTANANANWNTEGNGSFIPITGPVSRGFPQINAALTPTSISKSQDLYINLEGFISNYDSVRITIMSQNQTMAVHKTLVPPSNNTTFTIAELNSIHSASLLAGRIKIHAYNYSHRTINDKQYLFELGSKVFRNVQFKP